MKRVVGILLTVFLSVSCIVSAWAYDSLYNPYILNTAATTTEALNDHYAAANEAFTNLFESFAETEQQTRQANANADNNDVGYTVGGVSSNGFPDYYSGAYVNTYGNLVVLLNEEEVQTGKLLKSAEQKQAEQNVLSMTDSENITFGSATYSYSELVDVMTEITEFCNQESAARPVYTIKSYEIDDYDNCVNVYLNVLSPAAIQWFQQNVSDAECIEFYEEVGNSELLSTTNPGDAIESSDGGGFSLGFRVKTTSGTTKYGFVTCAHGFNTISASRVVRDGGVNIGTLDTSRAKFSGNVDAVFCERTSSSAIITNKVVTNSATYTLSTSTILGPAQGGRVYSYGRTTATETGAVRSGTVTSLSASTVVGGTGTNWSTRTLTDLYRTSLAMKNGDSGGPLFGSYNSAYAVAGIVCAGNQSTYTYFSKGINIQSQLGVFVY